MYVFFKEIWNIAYVEEVAELLALSFKVLHPATCKFKEMR
jgi:hypothetical protein